MRVQFASKMVHGTILIVEYSPLSNGTWDKMKGPTSQEKVSHVPFDVVFFCALKMVHGTFF